jgi:hypothetical protein
MSTTAASGEGRPGGSGLYPPDTPISQMGLDASEVAVLTDGAKQLTKNNLVILREVTKEFRSEGEDKVITVFDQRTGLGLTVGDVSSVAHAFDDMQDRLNSAPVAAADACCCCTCCPCCSCTASVVLEATR